MSAEELERDIEEYADNYWDLLSAVGKSVTRTNVTAASTWRTAIVLLRGVIQEAERAEAAALRLGRGDT